MGALLRNPRWLPIRVDGDFCVAGVGARTNLALFKDKLELAAGGIKVNGR